MKYCIFSRIVVELLPEETVEKLQKYGYDGIEWVINDNPHLRGHFSLREFCEKTDYVRKITESHNLETVSLISYLSVQDQDIENIEKLFRAAEEVDCQQVRLLPPSYDGKTNYHQLYNQGLRGMEKVSKLAERYDLRVVFEVHGKTIMPSASLAYRWASNFDSERVRIIFDPGNMIQEGKESWKMGLEILGDYLAYVHCKNVGYFRKQEGENFKWYWKWVGLNEGMVDWEEMLRILRLQGYDGYLSNEDFREIPPPQKLKEDIDYLKTTVQKVSLQS